MILAIEEIWWVASLHGFNDPCMMKSVGHIDQYKVLTMIGHQVSIVICCCALAVYLHSHTFLVDCYIFPLVILGISKLAQLGTMKANRKNFTIEFEVGI